ncbi:Phophatidylserine decarboxylase-domain-containing protein [Daedaleopsis nitida]|nr:Phophatidylserine decarboxylase-domain-containing protein [Daedaleopsis nitida]
MASNNAPQTKQSGKGSRAQGFMYHRHIGGWLPQDHQIVHKWVNRHMEAVKNRKKNGPLKLVDVVQRFKDLIEGDPNIYMGFHEMFTQVPEGYPLRVDNYIDMLELFDDILQTAPEYEDNALIGFPINAILDWPMGTEAGYRMFTTEKVNAMFKELFDKWVKFLEDPKSCYVLDDKKPNQWFWPANVMQGFVEDYNCTPGAEHWGFTSWDEFFTRTFRPGRRDPPTPEDPAVVLSACESTPYRIASDVKRFDQFWLKGQPYSVQHMLHCSETDVQPFIGGTVYQAFLSAREYHRWHSPVNGVVKRIEHVAGTYYAESREARTPEGGLDPAGPDLSQAFITNLATRVVIWIEAEAPVGMMCFVAVGMAEVSSCAVNKKVVVGGSVTKGQEIGMFHYGGSTHCLVFNNKVKVEFSVKVEDPDKKNLVLLNTKIATVSQKTQ